MTESGMPSVMQLRFSDIVSLDADTFFIPLSLCFQSAIKVIGVCEYFDSMVKSDNCDLKWPLEDVKFRQDLRLSLLQIQMIWLKQSWPLLIGWSTLFCLLIGKSRKSSSLSGWCLCLERQPVWTLWQSRFLTWWNSTTLCSFPFNSILTFPWNPSCVQIYLPSRGTLSPAHKSWSHLNILKKAKNCRQGSSFSGPSTRHWVAGGLSLYAGLWLAAGVPILAPDWSLVSPTAPGLQERWAQTQEWERSRAKYAD